MTVRPAQKEREGVSGLTLLLRRAEATAVVRGVVDVTEYREAVSVDMAATATVLLEVIVVCEAMRSRAIASTRELGSSDKGRWSSRWRSKERRRPHPGRMCRHKAASDSEQGIRMLSVPKVIERGGLTRKPEASDSIPSGRARRGQSKERSALCTSQSGSAG